MLRLWSSSLGMGLTQRAQRGKRSHRGGDRRVLAFDGSGGESLDDFALEQEDEDDEGEGADDCGCGNWAVRDFKVGGSAELGCHDGDGFEVFAGDEGEGEDEFVPGEDEGENSGGDEGG